MNYKNINAKDFNELAKKSETVILDVRSAAEYKSGTIPGAQTGFDFLSGEFSRKINQLDPNTTYLIYCRSGNRSGAACSQLSSKGFTQVYNLTGGIGQWRP
ncbi:MAG TPA: rhodanese-like domain-containing protein [Luteibaculaceae bacterium]|nr:rhodanese-like domain-containing protein [Luteibaculaceae bacterium]